MLRTIGWIVFWIIVIRWVAVHPDKAAGVVHGIASFINAVFTGLTGG